MNKKFLSISLFIATIAIVCISCSKEDDNSEPSNTLNGKTTAVFNSSVTYESMTDQDGNVYKTVTIGTQTWMAENLRTTKYNDGTVIHLVTDNSVWVNLTTGSYCNYDNTSNNDTIATFGRLYNWYAVRTGKLAPIGWHVPTDEEWSTLTTYLGSSIVAGGKLKEIGTTHWTSPNTEATNEIGFTALPGGCRGNDGTFYDAGNRGYWWSATEDNIATVGWARNMYYYGSKVSRGGINEELGYSIRCLKD